LEESELITDDEAIRDYRAAEVRKLQSRWKKAKEILRFGAPFAWIINSLVFSFTITGAEEIIQKNNLSPQTDLTQPGQLIPLIIGGVIMADGMLGVVKWYNLRKRSSTDE